MEDTENDSGDPWKGGRIPCSLQHIGVALEQLRESCQLNVLTIATSGWNIQAALGTARDRDRTGQGSADALLCQQIVALAKPQFAHRATIGTVL